MEPYVVGFRLRLNTLIRVSKTRALRKPELGLSDLEHGNETAVQTDSVRENRHRLSVRFLLMTSPPLQLSN